MTSVELTGSGAQEEVSLVQLSGNDGNETAPQPKVGGAFFFFSDLVKTELTF